MNYSCLNNNKRSRMHDDVVLTENVEKDNSKHLNIIYRICNKA